MRYKQSFFISCAALVLCITSLPIQARIKCWTNNEGVRECGESVPPEFAQKGHAELSKQGMVLEEQDRAKTQEELAEAAKQAALEAEEKRKEEERAKEDHILLQTFSSVGDIELVREEQLTALEGNIKVTEQRKEKIRIDLDKRIQAAASEERAGKTPNQSLLQDIESLQRQIKTNNQFIVDKRKEQEAIRKEYDVKIARFKELRGIE